MFVLSMRLLSCRGSNLLVIAISVFSEKGPRLWGGGSHPEIVDYGMAGCGWFPHLCCS